MLGQAHVSPVLHTAPPSRLSHARRDMEPLMRPSSSSTATAAAAAFFAAAVTAAVAVAACTHAGYWHTPCGLAGLCSTPHLVHQPHSHPQVPCPAGKQERSAASHIATVQVSACTDLQHHTSHSTAGNEEELYCMSAHMHGLWRYA